MKNLLKTVVLSVIIITGLFVTTCNSEKKVSTVAESKKETSPVHPAVN
jgi:hypothetical protein